MSGNKIATLLATLSVFAQCQKVNSQTRAIPVHSDKGVTAVQIKADSIPHSFDADCHITGPVISRAKDFEGSVYLRGDSTLYSITYGVPNTSDTQIVGYVCNMTENFKKDGLRVKFSGDYYHAYKYFQKTHAGEIVMYLYLTSIKQVK